MSQRIIRRAPKKAKRPSPLNARAIAQITRARPALEITMRRISDLQVDRRNARKHSDKQISRLSGAIGTYGFLVPIVVDAENTILAGHARLEAAKRASLSEVPCVVASHLSGDLKRAFVLAENRLAELAEWDEDLLKIELSTLAANLDLDIELTGFDTVEVDNIILGAGSATADPDDDASPVDTAEPITRPGTIWVLDRHRLLCGNALDPNAYSAVLRADRADMVFTDPPYNVRIAGHVSGLGKHKHNDFAMASGEMSQTQFRAFLRDAARLMARYSRDGALHFICMDWRHIADLMEAASAVYDDCKNMIVWVKSNGAMGTFYRSQHELITVFKVGTAAHTNNFGLGTSGRYRTNVWEYPGVNTFRAGRNEELAMHPTVKPVALVADAIRDCSRRNDIILDPFGGSGTTLIAAHRTGRTAHLIELEPCYCDVTVARWQRMTGLRAIHEESGLSFDEMLATQINSGSQKSDRSRRQSAPRRSDRAKSNRA